MVHCDFWLVLGLIRLNFEWWGYCIFLCLVIIFLVCRTRNSCILNLLVFAIIFWYFLWVLVVPRFLLGGFVGWAGGINENDQHRYVGCGLVIDQQNDRLCWKIAINSFYYIPERCVSILFRGRCGRWQTAERKANGFSSSVEITSCWLIWSKKDRPNSACYIGFKVT